MATELQHNLDTNYTVQGIVKPGADLEVMLHSNMKDCESLTNKDILIISLGFHGHSRVNITITFTFMY
jgi:hypothetical protein